MNALYATLGLASLVPLGIFTVFAVGSVIGLAGVVGLNSPNRIAGALAIALGVAIAGYGAAETATHLAQAPAETTMSVTPATASASQSAAPMESTATSEARRALPVTNAIEGPRECAPERGIADACTFN